MTMYREPPRAFALLRRVATEARLRREITRLETLDDHLLRDIGLDRTSIRRAVRGGH